MIYIISYIRCKIKEEKGTYTDGKVESHAAFGVGLQLNIGQVGHSTRRGIQLVVTQQHVVAYNISMYSSALHSSQQHVVVNTTVSSR